MKIVFHLSPKKKNIVFSNKNMNFDPNSCNISKGNEILERFDNKQIFQICRT